MKDTYYVWRGVLGTILSMRMSTPRRMDALKSAADSAIANPGFTYVVYKNESDNEIAKFYVKEED